MPGTKPISESAPKRMLVPGIRTALSSSRARVRTWPIEAGVLELMPACNALAGPTVMRRRSNRLTTTATLGMVSAISADERVAVDRGIINYLFLARLDPSLEPLRSEPRFLSLMETVRKRWERFEA